MKETRLNIIPLAARVFAVALLITVSSALLAQNDRKVNRQGVKSYEHGDYSEAEVQFRMAEDINHESFEAEYNTGAALYKQEKYEESFEQFGTVAEKVEDPEAKANVWHNVGNSLLESQKYAESIEAYKSSLRLNPSDQDTKYNLAYAKQKLEEQQEQENQDQENQENQDQDQDQENQDQENSDQENQDQEQQEQQDQENQEPQDQENQDQEQKDQEQKEQEAKPMEISREDAERLLEAIQQQEKDVKDKVDKKKAAAAKVKTEKDW